jgi:hypothetical protein
MNSGISMAGSSLGGIGKGKAKTFGSKNDNRDEYATRKKAFKEEYGSDWRKYWKNWKEDNNVVEADDETGGNIYLD